jgi:hypothetical protein
MRLFAGRPAGLLGSTLGVLLGAMASVPAPAIAQPAPGAQTLNPDISAIGDFIIDLSPERPRFTDDEERFTLREVEVGIQAVVDPFFRVDFFLGVHADGVEVEEAYVTALSLPGSLQARLGRFRMPFGKVNLTHQPELLTVEYPRVVQEYFGSGGFAATGAAVSKVFAPLGFYQEFQFLTTAGLATGADAHGGHTETDSTVPAGLAVEDGERRGGQQVTVTAHLRNYHDLSAAANIEVGLSATVGSVERLALPGCPGGAECPYDAIREFRGQRFYGANVIYRWRPPHRALYRSFHASAEVVVNDGPESTVWGGFAFAQWQLRRRSYLSGRFDAVQEPGETWIERHALGTARDVRLHREPGGEWLLAGSGYLTFMPSEFSRFRLAAERLFGEAAPNGGQWRVAVQSTFSIGPHRPHPF